MGMNLFDDAADTEDISKIETNKDFARRYEHNKKREELHRYQELKKKGLTGASDASSSESEEEDEEQIGANINDNDLCDAILRIRYKDPTLFEKDQILFKSDDEEESDDDERDVSVSKSKNKKKKPMRLKDVIAKQLIEEDEKGFKVEKTKEKNVKSYTEEQDEIRRQFLNAAEEAFEGDGQGDLLKEKDKKGEEEDEVDEELQKKLKECLDGDEFLTDYLLKKKWIDKDREVKTEDLSDISEDEEEVEKQEKFEAKYNFRFEEGAGDRVLGHARVTEGSVRKKSNARKLQRERKEERKAQAERERAEEVKHAKNLMKKERYDKFEKVKAIAGIKEGEAFEFTVDDMEGDFDLEEYDRKAKMTFSDKYYEKDDVDPGFCSDTDDIEKPDFDKEDVLLGLEKGWDDDFHVSDNGEEEAEEIREEGKRKRKRKIPLAEKVNLSEELSKFDYEGTAGGMKTRFPYTKVEPNRFGMSTMDILTTDDKELNQEVSLKKIAPYREKEWVVSKKRRFNQKKDQLAAEGLNLKDKKGGKKNDLKNKGHSTTTKTSGAEQEKPQVDASNGEVPIPSRNSRRKRRLQDLKPSIPRLLAYKKINARSKTKKKQ